MKHCLALFRFPGCELLLVTTLVLAPSPAGAQTTRKLNDTLPNKSSFDLTTFRLSPDGESWFAYFVNGSAQSGIVAGRTDGSGPVQPLVSSLAQDGFLVSPDGSRIVWARLSSVYSRRVDGSEPAVLLGTTVATSVRYVGFAAGQRIVFTDGRRLYSAPLDGAQPAALLADAGTGPALEPVISPAGDQLVFSQAVPASSLWGVWSVPTDGSSARERLGTITSTRAIPLRFTPDGTQVVCATTDELVRLPADGVGAELILATGSVFGHHEVSQDGQRVLYLESPPTTPRRLFSVPIDGSAPPLDLSAPLVAGGGLGLSENENRILQSPDGSRVAFVADKETQGVQELFVVPTDGSSPAWKVSGTLASGGDVELRGLTFTPDGQRLLYLADALVGDQFDLWSVPTDASTLPICLDQPVPGIAADVGSQLRLTADGEAVVFVAAREVSDTYELWNAPVDGSAAPVRLSAPMVSGGDVTGSASFSHFELTGPARTASTSRARSRHASVGSSSAATRASSRTCGCGVLPWTDPHPRCA